MKLNVWKLIVYVIIALGILVGGFFLGRKTHKEVEYIKGDTITDTLKVPYPVKEIVPADTLDIIKQCIKDGIYADLFPPKTDTLFIKDTLYLPSKEDTAAIIKDWGTKRFYQQTLFDGETTGHFDYSAEVQYNRLTNFSYNYTPVIKKETEVKTYTKTLSPFIGISYLSNPWDETKNPMVQLNAGLFLREKIGVNLIYQRGFVLKNDYVGAGVLYKF